MKAVVVHQPGGVEQLKYQEVPTPQLKAGWSLVKVKAFGINHSEIFTRRGDSPSVKFPRILGIECVGIIAGTTDPARLPVGQQVVSIMGEMGRAFDGSYAEYTLLPNEQIYPVTTDLAWSTLAAIPETYYTAYGSLLNLKLADNDQVLVRGASSGVGVAFAKLVRALYPKITITGTTRHRSKGKQLQQIGYDQIIVDQNGQLQTTDKYTKVLELIGPATMKDTFKHVYEGGIVCSTGQLGNQWFLDGFDPIIDLAPNSYLTSFYSGNVDEQKLKQLLDLISVKQIDARPEKVFDLSQLAAAHQYLESQNSFGKVVVVVE